MSFCFSPSNLISSLVTYRLLLQYIKLNSRVIAIIGLLISISGAALMADWQSIPGDPCTQLSPFHHPKLVAEYSNLSLGTPSNHVAMVPSIRRKRGGDCINFDVEPSLQLALIHSLHIYADVELGSADAVAKMRVKLPVEVKCETVEHCNRCVREEKLTDGDDTSLLIQTGSLCLHYTMSAEFCLSLQPYSTKEQQSRERRELSHYSCAYGNSPLAVCVELGATEPDSGEASGLSDPSDEPLTVDSDNSVERNHMDLVEEILYENRHAVHSQALDVLELDVYTIAMNVCESAVVPHHQCYWVPNSRVTKHHCGDCQPICRSIERSLNFVQFVLGASLLMVAIPIAWVPIAALISDRVPRSAQVSNLFSLKWYVHIYYTVHIL